MNCGRNGIVASRKNAVITDPEGEVDCMLFGKIGKDGYMMSVKWPLSPYQAFAIAICSVEHRPHYV